MKNIFLSFGSHSGFVVRQLDNLTSKLVFGEGIIWDEIHLFEPQAFHEKSLIELAKNDHRINYHKCAVSTENKYTTLYVKGDLGFNGSTIDPYKYTGALHNTETVQSIDIIEWIRVNTNQEDFICIDMDIECEEYNILPKLLETDLMSRIKFVSIEFHTNKSSYWSKDNLDAKLKTHIIDTLKEKYLDHDKYFPHKA